MFQNPLIVKIEIGYDTPLGFLLFQSLTREVVDVAKYMIDKGMLVVLLFMKIFVFMCD